MRCIFPILLGIFLALTPVAAARTGSTHDCVSFTEASKHTGTSQCVTGIVQHVENGSNGTKFISFCKEPKSCPFTVVVFPGDVRKMGDIRLLEGRQIEIKGMIQDYGGRAEIILRKTQQLGEAAFLLVPPVPTDYDVERPGHYSPGKFRHAKTTKTKTTKQGEPVSIEDPEEPQ